MNSLTKRLKRKGYKLKDFAQMMGVSVQHCYNLKKLKNKRFTLWQLIVLKSYLGDDWEEVV
jgi:hypothetical protein